MVKNVIKYGLILVVAILGYNYFFGTTEEKEQSEKIFHEVKDLGKAAWDLLKTEKAKLDEGKYDDALDKIGGLFNNLKNKAEQLNDSKVLDRLSKLEETRQDLEKRIADNPAEYDNSSSSAEKDRLEQEMKKLLQETEDLMNEMEEK